jgi:hypothetical protein
MAMLTIEQEFELKKLESELENVSDIRQLRALTLEVAKQNLALRNVFAAMVKGEFQGVNNCL